MVPLFVMGNYGLGHHIDTIGSSDMIVYNKLSFVQSVVALMTGIALLKIAIALELLSLGANGWRWYIVTLWISIGKFPSLVFSLPANPRANDGTSLRLRVYLYGLD